MLFVVKPLIFLYLSAFPGFADACCQECRQGHICASLKEADQTSACAETVTPTPPVLRSPSPPDALKERYPQLLVFVSFSMPMEALKTLGAQVNQLGGALVFRGLVEGSFKKIAEKFKELSQPALIDPTLFEAYKITAVPTFVFRQKATDPAEARTKHDRMQGHVSLIHALEEFECRGDLRDAARTLLQKLRKTP